MSFDEVARPQAPDPRALGVLVAEVERLRDAALRAAGRSAPTRTPRPLPADLSDDERNLVELLGRLREVALGQPAVGQAITSFLVAEGRRFAATDHGARVLDLLREAPEVERLRQIWEATTLNVFDDEDTAPGVPTAWIDLITDLASVGRVDRIVGTLLLDGLP
jgi:hypothetical protein